jgi:L-lactate dehydrogenase complex protein LldE
MTRQNDSGSVGLLVTCLVDLFRPEVAFASASLIEDQGFQVEVPEQTCCGQPAFNSGDRISAIRIAKQVVRAFESVDYVVVPSGSCAAMVRVHYPSLLEDEADWHKRAVAVAERTYELTSFLVNVCGVNTVEATCPTKVAMHENCSARRELKIVDQPRTLLGNVRSLQLVELKNPEECCGFGGTFCAKYPEISQTMVDRKLEDIANSSAELLVSTDMGCLLNIAGRLQRLGSPVAVRHIAEVLSQNYDASPIGHGS